MLIVESAMVNPKGKSSRLIHKVPNDLLNKEWIQIRNPELHDISLDNIELMHWEYPVKNGPSQNTRIMRLKGTLPGGASLRIHSGSGSPWMDEQKMIIHMFVNQTKGQYLYQLSLPDCIILALRGGSVDYASYTPPVVEGKRLKRTRNLGEHRLAAPVG